MSDPEVRYVTADEMAAMLAEADEDYRAWASGVVAPRRRETLEQKSLRTKEQQRNARGYWSKRP